MQTYLIDTNIFLRTLMREDEKTFHNCTSFLRNIKENKYKGVVPDIVFTEVVWNLSSFYDFEKKRVIEAVRSIQNLSGLSIWSGSNYHLALELYEKKSVKFVDAIIASIPEVQNEKWIIVSYDKDFDKLEVQRLEPDNLN